jgi:hypothetical protein
MTAFDIYKAQYEWYSSCGQEVDTKYEWAASSIFNLTTYDAGLDEVFVKAIIEVCKVILERKNFEYIRNKDNYAKYILVCQMLERFEWIDWGTSIRGAWFEVENRKIWGTDTVIRSKDILEELEWGDHNGWHTVEGVPFTEDNLRALIEFMEE